VSRRRLSDRQKRLIEHRQLQADGNPGRLIAHITRLTELIATPTGELLTARPRQNLQALVAGDRVRWLQEGCDVVITAVEPRQNLLQRLSPLGGRPKPVAANLTQLVVVFAPEPEPSSYLLDRYLLMAAEMGARALLVCNKADLPLPAGLAEWLRVYAALGWPLMQVSTRSAQGMDELRGALAGQVSVLVGQSGVGKSALAQRLLPAHADEIRVGAGLSENDEGLHTTRHARWYPLPSPLPSPVVASDAEGAMDPAAGALIDTPGVRDFLLPAFTPTALATAFPEVSDAALRCRYRDCRHSREPECAVQAAVAAGDIASWRFEHWQTLHSESERPGWQLQGLG